MGGRSTDNTPRVEGPPVHNFSDVRTPRSRAAASPGAPSGEPAAGEGLSLSEFAAQRLQGIWENAPEKGQAAAEELTARKEAVRLRNMKVNQ